MSDIKFFWGDNGWGWKLYGIARLTPGKKWFIGYSRNLRGEL